MSVTWVNVTHYNQLDKVIQDYSDYSEVTTPLEKNCLVLIRNQNKIKEKRAMFFVEYNVAIQDLFVVMIMVMTVFVFVFVFVLMSLFTHWQSIQAENFIHTLTE
ncbi:hypothetical protein F4703DRAFT_1799186 [Phycomyces blakesleeanus]|uniref:Uncharacterized protein n=1 Tax=Phycomyces blakesleeanus (strain ATCC 8743b / DSM 1359 / FGSC 10004 / NBRC 33097 / NRRL 1555) TaxID=763407 RepID=A0A167NFJ9_PHYB8|nr:hypothetical protein PHYBLDRAFT_165765 [Phycomyces blakesleeanus NRRL 1555(-)]OAD75780.1 hypothetical protein PHYBLDRAFT_165765 [Phycomyces blakesleeanus NRRL 1555(-)]|eukprot:XP_018293820.1 hypothetical protein PHYBLDRAFT_165765 [Phycomyces blakesleeanus NRRL 1555(-)]